MRRPSSIETFTPSPSVTLHPALQAVLDNLDVQIDEELTRYRRQRQYPSGTATQRKKLFPPQRIQASGASAIGILKDNIQLPSPRSSIYANDAYANAANPSQPQAIHYREEQPIAPTAPAASMAGFNSPSASPPITPLPLETLEPTRITSYAEQNDLSAYTPSAAIQRLAQQPNHPFPEAPNDYLASSEELLRSILEEDPNLRAEREPNSMLNALLTPVGIGSMLLLLLSSTTLGYVMMNPSSLGLWIANSRSPSSSPPSSAASPSNNPSAPTPDLASEEFVDIDLGTLSTLPKKSSADTTKPSSSLAKPSAPRPATPKTETASPATAAPVEAPAPEPQPSLETVVVPAAPPVAAVPEPAAPAKPAVPPPEPAPEPAPISPEPISAAPPPVDPVPEPAPSITAAPTVATAPISQPAPQKYYYVVTEYSGDSSLQQARGTVPDAYVRNLPSEGAKVQLGAFSDEAKAQELMQQLQGQGIQAEVYKP